MAATYNKVLEGTVVSLVAEVVGIEDEDEIDYIVEQVVRILDEEDDAALDGFMLTLSPRQQIVAGAVVGAVVKSWLVDEDLPVEGLPGYV